MAGVLLPVTAAATVALAAVLATYAMTAQPGRVRAQSLANLRRGDRQAARDADLVTGGGLVGLARKLTPAGRVRGLDLQLSRAGRPAAWPLERVLVTKVLGTAATAALMLLLFSVSPSRRLVAFAVVMVVLVWFLPEILLYNTAQKRKVAIQRALPDTLDQMTIAVEAGLGFESAMAHVARNGSGPLAEELIRTLQDIQVGQPRRDAYRALAERSPEEDLRRFLRAVIQAEQHGVSIAGVLSTQAQEMRIKRRQRAEEKAMQIPVKVVFPLILTILPVLFIIVMGPGVINMIDAFSGR
ncbi:type II secretion system F family protein [Ornithinimicrobium avium]|uniref:Type II secretion system F family protein n=1 Tax=Ornithinimicrobium avium TaxID=2283195 RepID=A0A345NKU0_9MICO|nr:type II secretion system F family protein [Ornithinimicrobium avium]AXH95648.1 type II secretion system F family protein [Ornithinimicrobium avium]